MVSQPLSSGLATVRNSINKHKQISEQMREIEIFIVLLILKAHYVQTVMLQQGYENS